MPNPTEIKSTESVAREIVSNCPTDHIIDSLHLASIGIPSPHGNGGACQKCIEKGIDTERKRAEEAEKELSTKIVDYIEICRQLSEAQDLLDKVEEALKPFGTPSKKWIVRQHLDKASQALTEISTFRKGKL